MTKACTLLIFIFHIANGFQFTSNNNIAHPVFSEKTESSDVPAFRIGHGYDIHRLTDQLSNPLVIAGVKVAHSKGPDAHSDGDAMYHSVVDAILGALCYPDIGQLFPDKDPQWKGADSSVFMKEAYNIMTNEGYCVSNLDVTLILQAPKVKDLKVQMRSNIAALLHTREDRVNVKARTHEEVDSVGEGRAYESHVVVLLKKM